MKRSLMALLAVLPWFLAGAAPAAAAPGDLVLENSFVSSTGWVKPGDTYPFTVRVKNHKK